MATRPSGAELVWTDAGIWVRLIIGVPLLVGGVLVLQRGQLFGLVLMGFAAYFVFEIVRKVALLRILGTRGVLTDGVLVRENEPEGESDWWSGDYEFQVEGRRYEHRVTSFMFAPRSSHGAVVGILFDPVDPNRAVVRGKYDGVVR